jgi:hypothetical protein
LAQTTIVLDNDSSSEERIPDLPQIGRDFDDSLVDLHSLANSVFMADRYAEGKVALKRVEIPLRSGLPSNVAATLEELFTGLYGYSPVFAQGKYTPSLFWTENKNSWSDDYTCLFSCGMDSYSGILSASKSFPVTGAFTLHSDFPTLKPRANKLNREVLSAEGIQLKIIGAPRHSSMARKTRGVLYVLNAVLLGNKNIIVPEIGPTMYQPTFTLLDEISVTTRPQIIQCAKKIAELLTGQNISIIKPNESLTKAEVAVASPRPELLRETCSCRSTMFANSGVPHCGSCYACVVRRLGVEVAGIEDKKYQKDGFTGEGADNTAHLIRFSLEFLSDSRSLPYYVTEIIHRHGKEDLFERFALDNLAGLMLLTEKGVKHDLQKKLLLLVQRSVDQKELHERIAVVRGSPRKPDFGNMV